MTPFGAKSGLGFFYLPDFFDKITGHFMKLNFQHLRITRVKKAHDMYF